jgi:chromosome partitioning protein
MNTIVISSLKGGVGKTTICWNLAVKAARHGKSVNLVDRDPSHGLTTLFAIREQLGKVPENLALLENVGRLPDAKKRLVEIGQARDFLIVDTPNAFMEIVNDALAAADVICIPVRPSLLDILAQEDLAGPITAMGKTGAALFVVNMIDKRSMVTVQGAWKRARQLLENNNKVVSIAQRVAYSQASERGHAGAEIDRDAAAEIVTLWRAIDRILKKGKTHATRQSRQSSAQRVGR